MINHLFYLVKAKTENELFDLMNSIVLFRFLWLRKNQSQSQKSQKTNIFMHELQIDFVIMILQSQKGRGFCTTYYSKIYFLALPQLDKLCWITSDVSS